MNNAGTIIGLGNQGSLIYDRDELRVVATNVVVEAVNDAGTAIGMGLDPVTRYERGWVCNKQGNVSILDLSPNHDDTVLSGINRSGRICGYDRDEVNTYTYFRGQRINLPSLNGNSWTVAVGINDNGEVVGSSGPLGPTGQGHAVLWSHGAVTDLGFAGYAEKLNNQGQVIGFNVVSLEPLSIRAVFYSDGTVTDLGEGSATDINNSGQVIGQNYDNDALTYSAFLFSNGVKYDLGEGEATGINNSGQVIGLNYSSQTLVYSAFLYVNGVKYALKNLINNPPLGLLQPIAINDAGQILVYTALASPSHTYLLSPISTVLP